MSDCAEICVGLLGQLVHLFSWGANSHGQLNLGHKEDQLLPKEVPGSISGIKRISGGGGHTLCVLDDGTLLACGNNDKGQLGPFKDDSIVTFSKMQVKVTSTEEDLKSKVIQAVGGWDFTVILNNLGEVYTTGANAFGQLGRSCSQASVLGKVEIPEKVVDIAAGLRHCVALTDSGSVYTWGAGRKGQLGLLLEGKIPAKVFLPTKVEGLPSKVIKVKAGAYHTMVLLDTGQLVVWGCNRHGQLGVEPEATTNAEKSTISSALFDGSVVDIHSGWTHNIVITSKGSVYSWGRSDYGQLGRSCDKSYDHIPQPIKGLENIKSLSCGSEHNLAVSENGQLFSWGWNEHGICGTGDEVDVPAPRQVAALAGVCVLDVGCGAGWSFAICSNKT